MTGTVAMIGSDDRYWKFADQTKRPGAARTLNNNIINALFPVNVFWIRFTNEYSLDKFSISQKCEEEKPLLELYYVGLQIYGDVELMVVFVEKHRRTWK